MIAGNYIMIVRGIIFTPKPTTDETLKFFKSFYQSQPFYWDGSLRTLDSIFDDHQSHFNHIPGWSATIVPV